MIEWVQSQLISLLTIILIVILGLICALIRQSDKNNADIGIFELLTKWFKS
jgi:hypothetical protein